MEAHKEKSDDSANHHGGLDMSFVETCTEMLVSAIRNGSTYKEYCAALDAVFKIPGLKEQVDEIRRLNYRVQNASEETKLYEEMDDLDEKMDALVRDTGSKPFSGCRTGLVQTAAGYRNRYSSGHSSGRA